MTAYATAEDLQDAIRGTTIKPSARLVALAIFDITKKGLKATVERIQYWTGLGRATILRHMTSLIDKALVLAARTPGMETIYTCLKSRQGGVSNRDRSKRPLIKSFKDFKSLKNNIIINRDITQSVLDYWAQATRSDTPTPSPVCMDRIAQSIKSFGVDGTLLAIEGHLDQNKQNPRMMDICYAFPYEKTNQRKLNTAWVESKIARGRHVQAVREREAKENVKTEYDPITDTIREKGINHIDRIKKAIGL